MRQPPLISHSKYILHIGYQNLIAFSLLLDTARLRSGFTLTDSASFAQRVERMIRTSVGVSVDEPVRLLHIAHGDIICRAIPFLCMPLTVRH